MLTPVADFAVTKPEVDGDRLALFGRSFAGHLAPRGAAAEPRIAALVCDPGQLDMGARVKERMPAPALELIQVPSANRVADARGGDLSGWEMMSIAESDRCAADRRAKRTNRDSC